VGSRLSKGCPVFGAQGVGLGFLALDGGDAAKIHCAVLRGPDEEARAGRVKDLHPIFDEDPPELLRFGLGDWSARVKACPKPLVAGAGQHPDPFDQLDGKRLVCGLIPELDWRAQGLAFLWAALALTSSREQSSAKSIAASSKVFALTTTRLPWTIQA
jgi:hypothetical protein